MGGPAEALSPICNGEIRGLACRHTWLVCLSECRHGDSQIVLLLENIYCPVFRQSFCVNNNKPFFGVNEFI